MILIDIILLGFVFILLVFLSWIWPPDSPWSPWWSVKDRESRKILKLVNISKKDTIYELGSGDGRFIIVAAREVGAKAVGIEIDPIRHFIASLKVRLFKLKKNVTLYRGNFYDYDISKATVVFVYLVPRVLEKLKPKLFKELKKGTKIISYRYKFENDKRLEEILVKTKNGINFYRII